MSDDFALLQPTTRFSNRVENYVKYRPGYPLAVVDFFEKEFALDKADLIADIGSGTGIFAAMLLKRGYNVACIEPNKEMRDAGETQLKQFAGFKSMEGRAEATGLGDNSVGLITAAQAFHWMDPVATKQEFQRILKPGGHIVLAWNVRLTNTPFLEAYSKLKDKFAIENISFDRIDLQSISSFFEPSKAALKIFANEQLLDFDALKGQLLSASYIPLPGHELYDDMISQLIQLFVAYNENGKVRMQFETRVFYNRD